MDRKEDAMRQLGRRITHLREEKRMTIPELAIRAGLDPAELGSIEAGTIDVRLTILFALARALEISPDRLLSFI